MANEQLRQAIYDAGLDVDQLADQVEVDVKTVYRWLAGRAPLPRLRAKVARALGREQDELWPELAGGSGEDEPATETVVVEILGAWPQADDQGAPDWQELLKRADDRVELLGHSLIDIVSVDGIIETLSAKADSGVRIRILISAPDSIWITAAAHELGQKEDFIGRPQLQLDVEKARGHLEPLAERADIELRECYADPRHTILRFDDEMLVSPHLYGASTVDAPLLYLRHADDDGLFNRWAGLFDALSARASEPIRPAPDLYPDPATHPGRYQPLTRATYEQEREAGRLRHSERARAPSRAIEEVRAELRRGDQPADAPALD